MASHNYAGMDIVDDRTATLDRDEKKERPLPEQQWEKYDTSPVYDDPFGNEENAEVQYKTLSWWYVSCPAGLALLTPLFPGNAQ